jgi:PPP family 3-phenylpropionic acid transporter
VTTPRKGSPPLLGAPPSRFFLRAYYFAAFAGFGIYLPFFPRWLESRGVDGLSMGAVVALIPAMSVLAPPSAGWLADRFRLRGSLLRWTSAGAAASFSLLALACASGALSPAVLALTVGVFAFCRSPMTLLADVIALEHTHARGTYGLHRLWGSLGFLLTAVAAGVALDPEHAVALPLAVGAAYGLAWLSSFALPRRAPPLAVPPRGHVRELFASPDLALFFLTAALSQAGHAAYDVCYSLHLRDLGKSNATVGALWALGVVAEVALMALGPRFLSRRSPARWLGVALLGATLRWGLLCAARSTASLALLQPLHALSFALVWISSLEYVKARVPGERLATAQGLFQASTAAGSVLGMLIVGPLYARAGGVSVFGFAAATAGAAWLTSRGFAKRAHG